ncbi:MAG: aminotransferase class V-fold PLP-dependent enzyme [Trueperaceae bacterium]|nr:aminotransferase class V-fold PLP-dependent enzyme [Trueperaceae bacterium]
MRPDGEVLLLTPGPTPIHPRALAAFHWPMRGHMDPDVFAYNDAIVRDLKTLYRADDDAFASLLSGTGSLGMETGLANLLEPGDRLLVAANGVFGERMVEMGRRLGADVHVVRAPLGQPLDAAEVVAATHALAPQVLAVVHGETSTGVVNPVPEIAEGIRGSDVLFSVDAVTTVGMTDFEMAAWGVDYAYTGSQKCLSAPPGVAPVVYSARAMARIEARDVPVASWYADAVGMRAYWDPDGPRSYHHTVPVHLHWATGEAIRAALDEGFASRAERVRRLDAAILATLEPHGFAAAVDAAWRLPTVLAVTLPDGLDDAAVRRAMRERHAVAMTGGLGPTAGLIWRLGLMGENARVEHYRRFMHALADVLALPDLPDRFEAAWRDAAPAREPAPAPPDERGGEPDAAVRGAPEVGRVR